MYKTRKSWTADSTPGPVLVSNFEVDTQLVCVVFACGRTASPTKREIHYIIATLPEKERAAVAAVCRQHITYLIEITYITYLTRN